MMIKRITICLAACVAGAVLLAGCKPPEPTMFGVPQNQWVTLTPQQQQQVIRGYNQRMNIEQENAPINNMVSAARTVAVMDQQRKAMNHHQFVAPPPPGF